MSPVEIGLQVLLVVALGASVPLAVRLSRALANLRRDRAELDATIKALSTAVDEAEQSIQRLRSASGSAARRLADQVDGAEQAQAELRLLLGRVDGAIERLSEAERRLAAVPRELPARAPDPAPARAPDPAAGARPAEVAAAQRVEDGKQMRSELRALLARLGAAAEHLADSERRLGPGTPHTPREAPAPAAAPRTPAAPPQAPAGVARPSPVPAAAAPPAAAPPPAPAASARDTDEARVRAELAVLNILRGKPKPR